MHLKKSCSLLIILLVLSTAFISVAGMHIVQRVSPPDDRLLNPILAMSSFLQSNISAKLDSMLIELIGLRFRLADFNSSISAKLDSTLTELIRIRFWLANSPTQMLGYYTYTTGPQGVPSKPPSDQTPGVSRAIIANQPVKFTITLDADGVRDDDDYISLVLNPGTAWESLVAHYTKVGGGHQLTTVTAAGKGIWLICRNVYPLFLSMNVKLTVMVEGMPGTTVTVEDPYP